MDRAIAADAAIDRATLFFWLFLIATGNKLAGMAVAAVAADGWTLATLNLFGISAILWLAIAAGLILVRGAEQAPIRSADLALTALVLVSAIVPIPGASAAALTVLAAYVIATSRSGSVLRRAAYIFLAMTSSLIWGPLFLELFSGPLLGIDAQFVSWIANTRQVGNQIAFADGSGTFVVAPTCSSFHGMSLALVFWVTVNQWFEVRLTWMSVLWVAAALLGTIAINAARIAAIAHFPGHFTALHTGWGAQLASWTTLLLVVAICLYGARRDVFAKD